MLTPQINLSQAQTELRISGSPAMGETFTLKWLTNSLTWTVAATENTLGTAIPVQAGGQSLAAYADTLAELFRKSEILTDHYHISREPAVAGEEIVRFTYKQFAPLTQTFTEDLSNIIVAASGITAPIAPDNLRATVQVWTATTDPDQSRLLAKFHAPYLLETQKTQIDLHTAFAHLEPHLPPEASIYPFPNAAAWTWGEATKAYQKYFLRYADKYGTPATAEALVRIEGDKNAVFGSRSANAASFGTFSRFCHNYRTQQGAAVAKPVSIEQPDYLYYFSNFAGTVWASLLVRWSDGTTQTVEPFGTAAATLETNRLYFFAAGYRQLNLHTLAAPSAGAEIVGYTFRLAPQDDGFNWIFSQDFVINCGCSPWSLCLIFANGLGGCETVWLEGKTKKSLKTRGEDFQKARWFGFSSREGEAQMHSLEGVQEWKASTGWFEESDGYLAHLAQLPLADCWLVDLDKKKYHRVLVEPDEILTQEDDRELFSMQFTLRAAWTERAHNF